MGINKQIKGEKNEKDQLQRPLRKAHSVKVQAGHYTYAVKVELLNHYMEDGEPVEESRTVFVENLTTTYTVGTPSVTYTVTLDPCGGECSRTSISYDAGARIGSLPNPTLEDHFFAGWYTAPYSGSEVTSSTVVNNNMTLYAHWVHQGAKLNFNLNGGSFGRLSSLEDSSYTLHDYETGQDTTYNNYAAYLAAKKYGQEYSSYGELPIPQKTGYIFGGWYADGSSLPAAYTSSFVGINLSAKWSTKNTATTVASTVFNGHLYQVYDYQMTWEQAKAFCEEKGAHLVTITNEEENNAVTELIAQGTQGTYYIGASDAASEGNWKWVTGENLSYSNWDAESSEPNGGTSENYATIMAMDNPPDKDAGEWNDTRNDSIGGYYGMANCGFVCEYEQPSACTHNYQYAVTKTPTTSATGVLTGTCSNCGEKTTITLPKLNTSDYTYSVTTAATCSATGTGKYTWKTKTYGTFSFNVTIPKTAHTYTTQVTPPNCEHLGYTTYTCTVCGYNYVEYVMEEWSGWSLTYPTGVDPSLIQSKTQYRYADYQTVTSYEPSLSGYTLISSRWVEENSGTIDYVANWPSGFVTSHSLYSEYNNTPKTASETATKKVTVSSNQYGYIFYHYCRGTYNGGPINRLISDHYTDTFKAFHTFYSTTAGSRYDPDGRDGVDVQYKPNASVCRDSHWYYPLAVTRQNWTEYKKEFTYGKWGAWSAWQDTAVSSSSTRKVETRTLYRYAILPPGEHTWNAGVVTKAPTCTATGTKKYTCTVCGETKIETIPATGHNYQVTVVPPTCTAAGYTKHVCKNCNHSYQDQTVPATGHTWDGGVVTTAPQEGVPGVKTYTCTVCHTTRTETVPALPYTYTISYNANGGNNAPNAQTKTENIDIQLSTYVPERTGHQFLGWARTASATAAEFQPGAIYTQNAPLSLYAVWKANTYTVSFNANGGSGTVAAMQKTYGQAIHLPTGGFTRTGYVLSGWAEYSDSEQAKYDLGGSYNVNGNRTLYAFWTPITYTITLNPNGGTVSPESVIVTHGDNIYGLPVPSRAGYNFAGWYTELTEGEMVLEGTVVDENISLILYAHWNPDIYTLTYDSNLGTNNTDVEKTHGIDLPIMGYPSDWQKKTGYSFVGWSLDSKATVPDYYENDPFSLEGYYTLFAVWAPNEYTVYFDANGGTVGVNSITVTYDSLYGDLPVPEYGSNTFDGWYTSLSNGTIVKSDNRVSITEDTTLYAIWSAATVSGTCGDSITWTLNPSNGVMELTGSGNMPNYMVWTGSTFIYAPWNAYMGSIQKIIIHEGITSIGNYSFAEAPVSEVVFPEGLTTIGDYAFEKCINLKQIDYPESLVTIGAHAFEYSGIESMYISNTLQAKLFKSSFQGASGNNAHFSLKRAELS